MKRALSGLLCCFLAFVTGSSSAQDIGGATPGRPKATSAGRPTEIRMNRAGSSKVDLRRLPATAPTKMDWPERHDPPVVRTELPGGQPDSVMPRALGLSALAPAPSPVANFLGLDFNNWGAGRPPDTVGDVGPDYYIQAVNTSIGVFRKSDSVRVAAFTFNTFMSQGSFGNLCDTNNFGDPVILYDSFEDRWVISDFAFQLDGSGNVVNPPGAYQCFAVSQTGDPVTGGWNYYSLHLTDGLNDYPKLGIWPDGIYMSANMFGFPVGAAFMGTRVWALNKAQMYAGAPTIQVVEFSPPAAEFTLLPANARLQTGTPPPGSPNYFSVVWQYSNAISVYKFHVDWNSVSLSSFTGPFIAIAPASWASPPNTVPAQGGNNNDTLQPRLMMQNQYTNLGGVESIWNTHTVRGGAAGTPAAPRYYEVTVTGGTVAAATAQAATHAPDATTHRYMPSLAVDRAGNMALGYSASSSTLFPAIRYAGRLAADPASSLPQTETSLIEGTGSQNTSNRWGDYSAMSVAPDGCTFWYTNEYYITTGGDWQTRVGSFQFPSCTLVTTGAVQGTVTATTGGAPIGGAIVTLGSRTATTNASGFYSFPATPSGTYPGIAANSAGYLPSSFASLAVADGATTTRDFSLATMPASACPADTTQADFQTGVPASVDLTTSPGDVTLSNTPSLDQSNTAGTNTGTSFSTTSWGGQTFIPAVTGQLATVDVQLFCNGCTGTTPNLTLSVRATSAGLPTGADLATTTIPGFSSGAGTFYTGTFGVPATLTSGTQYALILRPVANPSVGGYFWIRSSPSTYANGQRVISTDNGVSFTADSTRDFNFKAYMQTGYAASGTQESSLKDANPAAGYLSTWTTLSFTTTMPANTALRFQAAGSNSPFGPFNYVGPDGTASTYFTTTGASLSQFNGSRYLKYKAYLSTTDSTATPTLSDVTVCFVSVPPPDLSITKTDGVATAAPGGSVTYTVTALNGGALPATGATVADILPAPLTCTWTCVGAGGGTCTAAGAGNINDTVNLPAGASVTYTAACIVHPAASGTLANTATVTFAADPNPANNSATDTDTLVPQADLSITKTDGVTGATAGGSLVYTIVASNAGPSAVAGVTVADTFPAALTGVTWTCVGAGGGTCTAAGSGNISDSVNLPAGSSVIYTASVTVSPSATGSLANTATVTPPGGVTDPNAGNNSATDVDALGASADLSITKTDSVSSVTAGGSVVYAIVASNAGPSAVTGATVADTFPATLTGVTWTCVGAGGGTCTAAGSGNISGPVNLPVGASVTFTATAALSASAAGSLANTATVTVPGGVTDTNPGNNSATDTDSVTPAPGSTVAGTKTATGTYFPSGTVTYTVTLRNIGPGAQGDNPGNEFTDILPAGLSLNSATATSGVAVASVPTNTVTWNGTIPASGTVTITIRATILPSAAGTTVSNQGTIAFDGDGNGTNEATGRTDDPGLGGASDPTLILVSAEAGAAIPTLSIVALILFGIFQAALALALLRRGGPA